PWAAPDALRAGTAPARPIGTADGVAGNGDGFAGVLRDRAHAPSVPLSSAGRGLHDRFVNAIDDDLDLPTALAILRETLREDLTADERRWLILDADFVLGLDLDRPVAAPGAAADVPHEIAALLAQRADARMAHDFETSDAVRASLAALGYEVTDGPTGQTVSRTRGRAASRSGR
ncbi:MAG: hypothetical protein H0V73_07510, partial [Chloroflexi bacterium]|nr:hypothetical protein [Chloroflexota bacterium]